MNGLTEILGGLMLMTTAATCVAGTPIYKDTSRSLDERVEDALSRMTTREKIDIIHAQSKFSSRGVPRLGIPDLWASDGPHGVRPEVLWDEWNQAGWTNDSCVAFPALTCLAATWNPELSYVYGKSLGEEARYRGKDIMLGPGVNILRTPLNGRNFEYMGEDPCLASVMVVPYIKGLQSNGVAACVKHYALNNNELNRHTTNVKVDERTLHEIYLPAFKAAVQQGEAWSLMAAYCLTDNEHLCHNDKMLNRILKDDWGFDGAVVSDWGGTHDTYQAIHNGLDLEFGSWTNGLSDGRSNAYDSYYMAQPYLDMIEAGKVGINELDDKARRVLKLIFRTAMDYSKGDGEMCSADHYSNARRIADEGIVLLQNRSRLLPIDLNNGHKKILVVGENAVKMMTVGGGSSSLKVQREISPLAGIRAMAGGSADVEYARGYVGDTASEFDGVNTGQNLKDERSPEELIAEAVGKAQNADYVIFVGGLNKSWGQDCEDSDRKDLGLPYGQDDVIRALAAVNPNIIVVNISGNPVSMPWVASVGAILQAWYIGSEAGNAIADVIFGKVNPSGKLPMTFPAKLQDSPAHALGAYPGVKRDAEDIWDLEYKEGIMVGYRWFDAKKIKPLFAFGHGMSYTDFGYGRLEGNTDKMSNEGSLTLTVDVTNTGDVPGAEVVQLYITDSKCKVLRPKKELKQFSKVYLEPGETKKVTFSIDKTALSYYDPAVKEWVAEPGQFVAHVGGASDDIKSSFKFMLE